jgi:DNA polymerase III delta prime subunit
MPEDDILLIQGPPGTGKTHTITGLISMFIGAGVRKVMICAPSNFAIDEVISRISNRGFIGLKNVINPKGQLLRLGALEYEASSDIVQHTLDARCNSVPTDSTENVEKIKIAQSLLKFKGNLEKEHVNQIKFLASTNDKGALKFISENRGVDMTDFL